MDNNRENLTIQFSNLPLAVYREIAAHLCQVEEVETKLLPTSKTEFNYNDSQIESLQIQLPAANLHCREQVEKILAYYQNIFGVVQRL
ncbi:hypothetical protein [Synechocystis sp. PCC 7509]|uniref:hypothetical protein n=1 Tax=Synechocystis sp. PCC 7509 TaxID=927677 RepID=UPI0002ACB0DD|nr:hypothetical protein [Synechocystis sp. PCC 7509]